MIIISPTELRANQKKYFDLAENEKIIVKRGNKLIELVVKEQLITEDDIKSGVSGEDLKQKMHKRIDQIFNK